MASGRLFIPGWMPARDSNGDPIPNVVVSFYQNETDVLASVYADDALTVPLTNPVAANSSGRFPQIYASDAMTYSASVDAPYGPAGQPFTFDGLQASQAADIAAANLAQGAAEDAEAALAATEAAIDAATQVGGGAAALAGALAGADAANVVVAGKANTDFGNVVASTGRSALGLAYSTQAEAQLATNNASTMTPLRAKQQLRTVVEYINPREPQYAGGSVVDGTTDCRAAVQAAIDYAKTLGTPFGGGCIKIKLPAGVINFTSTHPTKTDRVLDLTGCTNVVFEGEGLGATTLKFSSNVALFRNDETSASPLFYMTLKEFTIIGPYLKTTSPGSNLLSTGIYFGATNSCIIDNVRIYAVATGATWADTFHTEFFNLRINGQGDLAVRDGLYARDGNLALTENSVGIYGGRVFGCGRYGFRGECITGTSVFGLEVLGCGSIGVYLGDSPGGKDLKWFTWSGGLIDTCSDLLVVSKGASAVAEFMHWSGLWLGYASEGGGNGKGADLRGLKNCTFRADLIVNVDRGVEVSNGESVTIDVGTIGDYDRSLVGDSAVVVVDSLHCNIRIGTAKKSTGSPGATAYVETGTSNYNLITGVFDGAVTTIGAQSNKVGTIVY